LNLFEYIADLVNLPSLTTLFSFVAVNGIVAFGLFLFTALMMLVLEVLSGDNSLKVFKEKTGRILESPLFFVSVGILFGLIAYAFSLSVHERIWFFVVVGMLEEYVKFLVLRFADEEKILSVSDALSFSIIVALGFAFVENIFYFRDFGVLNTTSASTFVVFLVLRSTISVVAHVCFSAILGYFYGVARFADDCYREASECHRHILIHRLHQVLHCKSGTLFHEEKMMEGMLLAMLVHAIFNSLLEFEAFIVVIPFLSFIFVAVLNLFHRKQIHVQNGNLNLTTS
jgi:RsiW-degrading membrane proteinase PrsW (M82 family)